jgi:hypothetical protein
MRFRRLSFSLRALLLLVTALGIGLGWLTHELAVIRARKEWLARLQQQGGVPFAVGGLGKLTCEPCAGVPEQPILGRLLGDVWIPVLFLPMPCRSAEDVAEARRHFPEAYLAVADCPECIPEWFHRYGRETGLNAFTGGAYPN